ncbi:capsular polysaccharide export protein, LipB/KpsS family [Halorubrum cibi]|uniref:capsular polysaccharide export protein, LipB/KpsS family n=1 Tax=Halorubrum cibi TaxID=413815 RepID=UPI00163D78BB|nr:hypothetical protein [Halorubrum cibi]
MSTSRPTSIISNILGKAQIVAKKRLDSLPSIARWARRTIGKPVQAKVQQYYALDREDTREYVSSSKFVFYSLQYYRESRVTMRSPAFYDQAGLIKYLSRSVPHGTELLVKDHPQQLGAMPFSDIRQISRYVPIAKPSTPAHNLIEKAEAVVTLNNTVGHEAIVFGKPVVVLGSALYGDLESVVHLDDINDLDTTIAKVIEDGGLSNDDIRRYIDALFEISEPMKWGDPAKPNVDEFIYAIDRHLSKID